MASTVEPNKVNMQWNKKRKGDGSTAERRSNIIYESNRINGRATNIEKSGRRRKSENGSKEGCGDKCKMASKVGPNRENKQWNRKRKGDGDTAGRKSNKSGNNGMNSTDIGERAVDKGNMNTNIYKKVEGHTTGTTQCSSKKMRKKAEMVKATRKGRKTRIV